MVEESWTGGNPTVQYFFRGRDDCPKTSALWHLTFSSAVRVLQFSAKRAMGGFGWRRSSKVQTQPAPPQPPPMPPPPIKSPREEAQPPGAVPDAPLQSPEDEQQAVQNAKYLFSCATLSALASLVMVLWKVIHDNVFASHSQPPQPSTQRPERIHPLAPLPAPLKVSHHSSLLATPSTRGPPTTSEAVSSSTVEDNTDNPVLIVALAFLKPLIIGAIVILCIYWFDAYVVPLVVTREPEGLAIGDDLNGSHWSKNNAISRMEDGTQRFEERRRPHQNKDAEIIQDRRVRVSGDEAVSAGCGSGSPTAKALDSRIEPRQSTYYTQQEDSSIGHDDAVTSSATDQLAATQPEVPHAASVQVVDTPETRYDAAGADPTHERLNHGDVKICGEWWTAADGGQIRTRQSQPSSGGAQAATVASNCATTSSGSSYASPNGCSASRAVTRAPTSPSISPETLHTHIALDTSPNFRSSPGLSMGDLKAQVATAYRHGELRWARADDFYYPRRSSGASKTGSASTAML